MKQLRTVMYRLVVQEYVGYEYAQAPPTTVWPQQQCELDELISPMIITVNTL